MKGKVVTFRPRADLRARLDRLALATGHSLTYHIEKAIEAALPELEKRYAKELKELDSKPRPYPTRPDIGIYVEERSKKAKAR